MQHARCTFTCIIHISMMNIENRTEKQQKQTFIMKTALTNISSRSNIGLDSRFIYNLVVEIAAIAAEALYKMELMVQYVPITRSNTLIKQFNETLWLY